MRADPGRRLRASSSSFRVPDPLAAGAGSRFCSTFHVVATLPLAPVTPALLIPLLLPEWLDPEFLIHFFGPFALWGVAFIIFAECGLFAILPGDSLLFTVGLFVALGAIDLPVVVRLRRADRRRRARQRVRLHARPHHRATAVPRTPGVMGRIFKQSYVDKTHAFFEKYGNRALILARFVPIVRTFVTLVAGVGKMDFRQFITYTAIGGVLWACGVTILGFYLGRVPFIHDNIEVVLVLIVLVSVIPMIVEFVLPGAGPSGPPPPTSPSELSRRPRPCSGTALARSGTSCWGCRPGSRLPEQDRLGGAMSPEPSSRGGEVQEFGEVVGGRFPAAGGDVGSAPARPTWLRRSPNRRSAWTPVRRWRPLSRSRSAVGRERRPGPRPCRSRPARVGRAGAASRLPAGAGSPRRYLPVSSPRASGKYGSRLWPVCSMAGISSASALRFSQEYSFWAEMNAS